ncbi:MAG: DNA primase [Lentisphaeria bacterium]|nr:DNA primase [Lentisphaeria bacterium]
MNRAIPDEIVEDVRNRTNIVDLIGSYISLKRGGNGVYKGLCPFHNEKSPSFVVNEHRQHYHCFGCGKGGDIFSFVMEKENVDFPEAIHLLAARCNVIIPEKTIGNGQKSKEIQDRKSRLFNLMEQFTRFFENSLYQANGKIALEYLYKRGIDDEIIKKFRIGYAPDDWQACVNFAKSLGYSEAEAVETGTVRVSEKSGKLYDHFKGRLMFSIWDGQGRVVGFSGRTLDAEAKVAKYVNTAETVLFKKSQLLYALPFARSAMGKNKMAILCEGQLDVIAMHRANYECAVAPQGTAFTLEQAQILRRSTQKILLGFDSDNAGQNAILRAIEILLPLDFDIRVIKFPGGKDPDELFRNQGKEPIAQAVNNSIDWLEFFFDYSKRSFNFENPGDLNQVILNLVRLLGLIKSSVAAELYLKKASELSGVSYEAIKNEYNKVVRENERKSNALSVANEVKVNPAAKVEKKFYPSELVLLELAINSENAARNIVDLLNPEYLSDSAVSKVLNAVLDTILTEEYSLNNNIKILTELNRELREVEIDKLLVQSACSYSENQFEKIIGDCIKDLTERYRKNDFAKRLNEMKLQNSNNQEDQIKMLEALLKGKKIK